MEQVERRLSFTGLTIDSDPSLRMQARPIRTGIAPGAGKPREDFGSSGFKRSPQESKPGETYPASTQSTATLSCSNEDDDDIDLFNSPVRTAKIRTTTASASKAIVEGPSGVTYKGHVHEYHPDYLPKPKLPSFKKSRSTNENGDGGSDISSRADARDQPQQLNPPSKNLPLIPNQKRQADGKGESPTPPLCSSRPSSSPPKTIPKPLRPRPTLKSSTCVPRKVDPPDNSDNPVGDRVEEEIGPTTTKVRPKATKKQPGKYTAKAFPLLDDPSFQPDQPLQIVSNISPSRSRRSSPEASPVRSHSVRGEGKALVVSDDTEDRTGHVPQPFPLSTSFMNFTPKASKRHPEDETHSGGSERKKLKETSSSGVLRDGLPGIGNQHPDFLFLDPNIDPSTLCPWCDQQLPADPTPRLKSLIESVRSKSYSSPRPSNPLGLGAPLTASVAVCQRHRFESHQIPKAQMKGWPTKIDFGKVKPRVEALRSKLEALVLNKPSDADDLILLDEDEEKPRDTCPFWTEMVKEVKSKGSRSVASSKGQFANFKALQPGYYGELGYLIIHQTAYQMFPPETIDPDSTAPLTPSDFIHRILIPEASVYLIMEDLQSSYSSAIKTLRESVEYGVAMFPDTGGDNEEGMKAADDVVKERARARRKQLLEEEMEIEQRGSSEMEVELELSRASSPPKPAPPKKSRSKRGKTGASLTSGTSESERDLEMVDLDEPQILTQRPPTAKSRKPASGYRSDASNASNASLASRTSTRSMTKKQARKIDTFTTQPLDAPPLPASQPPKQQKFSSSYRTRIPSDHSSDVEVISDHSTRSTRSRTRDGTKSAIKQPAKNSKSMDKRSTKPPRRMESTPETDSDEELLKSSPFNPRRHMSQKPLFTKLEDLDVEETPRPQKVGSMKLNPDPWEISNTPTRQLNRSESQSSQNFAHLLAGDEDAT